MSNTVSLTEFLPEALSTFLVTHPNVNIDLEEKLSFEIVSALNEGTVDIGILANSVDVSAFETFPFYDDRLTLVTSKEHALTECAGIHFSETLDYDFIGLQRGSALQEFLSEQAARAGKRFKYRVRLRSFDAVCRMIERNVGVGVVPEVAAKRLQKSMEVRIIPILDAWSTRKLLICTQSFAELPIHAQHLIEQIRTS